MDNEYTSSSDESSGESYSSEESTRLESCHVAGERLQLPAGLCENKEIFNEFFSMDTWQNHLTVQQRWHLMKFLPTFPENNIAEREETLERFFSQDNMRFGSPLKDFQTQLHAGYFRRDIASMRGALRRSLARDNHQRLKRYYSSLLKDVLVSRQRLLERGFSQAPSAPGKMERPPPTQHRVPLAEQRTKRRYFQELAAIRQEIGESDHSSEDENYPEGPLPRVSKKQRRHLTALEVSLSAELRCATSTLALKPSGLDLEASVLPSFNPFDMTDEWYKQALAVHKRKRSAREDHPELNTLGITLQDVATRANVTRKMPEVKVKPQAEVKVKRVVKKEPTPSPARPSSASCSDMGDTDDEYQTEVCLPPSRISTPSPAPPANPVPAPVPPPNQVAAAPLPTNQPAPSPAVVPKTPTPANKTPAPRKRAAPNSTGKQGKAVAKKEMPKKIKVEEVTESPAPTICQYVDSRQHTAATMSDLDGIDMMNLPIDLDDTPQQQDIKPAVELMQETHLCFFSLLRDVICSTPEHRMNLLTLEDRLRAWQHNPISPLNAWYSLACDWVGHIPPALMFLCGDYTEAQPEDYVPYLEYKPHLQAYQWIGAGRDSDSHLQPLCDHWLLHRDEMVSRPMKRELDAEEEGDAAGEERVLSPPPPRCPTQWSVRPSNEEEKAAFRAQEVRRYENPHRAFTFITHDYESIVGPVKGVYNQSVGITKPRGHSLLVADRPNFVTILCLVRDATARLPNGEGTRSDICELLKDSQYLAVVDQETYLHSVVSGALDRLHYETDPCVRYDTKRKIWIYLHRGRTQEEFERLHQQYQGVAKSMKKSPYQRKPPRAKKPVPTTPIPVATAPPPPVVKQEVFATVPSPQAPPAPKVVPTPKLAPKPIVRPPPVRTQTPLVVRAPAPQVVRAPGSQLTVRAPRPQATQSLQVATPSGVQTIQITSAPVSIAVSGTKSKVVPTAAATATKPAQKVAQKTIAQQAPRTVVQPARAQLATAVSGVATTAAKSSVAAGKQVAGQQKLIAGAIRPALAPGMAVATLNVAPQQSCLAKPVQRKLNTVKAVAQQQTLLLNQQQQKQLLQMQLQDHQPQQLILQHQAKLKQSLVAPGSPALPAARSPLVGKLVANLQGQVISVESLLEHQKQMAQGSAMRVPTSLIQIPSSVPGGAPQYAVVSQGSILSCAQPRLLRAQSAPRQAQVRMCSVANSPRLLSPGINLATVGGKPVLLASKTAGNAASNVYLTTQAGGQVVLTSQSIRGQSHLVVQQGSGFTGGTLNVKTLQALQGLKVIPLAQAQGTKGGRQQVYARIINPNIRTSLIAQQTATATVLPSTSSVLSSAAVSAPSTSADSTAADATEH